MKKAKPLILLLSLAVLLGAVCAVTSLLRQRSAQEKLLALEETIAATPLAPRELSAQTEPGRLLLAKRQAVAAAERAGEARLVGDEAELPLRLTYADFSSLEEALAAALAAQQEVWLQNASVRGDVYEADGSVRRALLDESYPALLEELLSGGACTRSAEAVLRLRYADGAWQALNADELAAQLGGPLTDADAFAEEALQKAAATLSYRPLPYAIAEDALAGPVPNPANFGETSDPAVIEALLQRPEAQRLIGGQETVWNAGIGFFPNSLIRWYLDETILVLVWQEEEAKAVATFSEVFIADGSQIRRKVSADKMFDAHFEKVSEMGKRANAVLALGGDMYYHGRECGVVVYQREIYRFETEKTDVCYINGKGDLLFTYRGQPQSEEEARQFIEDNDVLFSLAFGPVLIDEGVDVMPERYPWGETRDEYARSVLAQMGERHYLSMNINHGSGRWYHLVTLRAAADAMVKRGAWKAYTLDGGQTATTVLNGKVINRVQFDRERHVSDILYFATAIPEEEWS